MSRMPPLCCWFSTMPPPCTHYLDSIPSQRGCRGRECVLGGLPSGVVQSELGAEVGPGEPLDPLHTLWVVVDGFGGVVAGDSAEAVLGADQGEQRLQAGPLRIAVPLNSKRECRLPRRARDGRARRAADHPVSPSRDRHPGSTGRCAQNRASPLSPSGTYCSVKMRKSASVSQERYVVASAWLPTSRRSCRASLPGNRSRRPTGGKQ